MRAVCGSHSTRVFFFILVPFFASSLLFFSFLPPSSLRAPFFSFLVFGCVGWASSNSCLPRHKRRIGFGAAAAWMHKFHVARERETRRSKKKDERTRTETTTTNTTPITTSGARQRQPYLAVCPAPSETLFWCTTLVLHRVFCFPGCFPCFFFFSSGIGAASRCVCRCRPPRTRAHAWRWRAAATLSGARRLLILTQTNKKRQQKILKFARVVSVRPSQHSQRNNNNNN